MDLFNSRTGVWSEYSCHHRAWSARYPERPLHIPAMAFVAGCRRTGSGASPGSSAAL